MWDRVILRNKEEELTEARDEAKWESFAMETDAANWSRNYMKISEYDSKQRECLFCA